MRVSLITFSAGSFVGKRYLAFVAEEAAKVGIVIDSESLSLSESDSESLTRTGKSK